jgi:hypothetical protein
LHQAWDDKQEPGSRDDEQKDDTIQAKWRQASLIWEKVEKKAQETWSRKTAKTTTLEPTEQQQLLDAKQPDHRPVAFVGGVGRFVVAPRLPTSDHDKRLCVKPEWD